MKNKHRGRRHLSLCLFLATYQALGSTCRLPSLLAVLREGWRQEEDRARAAGLAGASPKQEGWGAHVCEQLRETENSARRQSEGTEDVVCVKVGSKALKHQTTKCLGGRGRFSFSYSVIGCGYRMAFITLLPSQLLVIMV